MKQQDRARMRIGGEEVVEIDINASYLTILHGISGFALPERDDIYDISGIDRAIVKAWITSTIGHHSFHSRWPKNALAEIKAAGVDKPKSISYIRRLECFTIIYPRILIVNTHTRQGYPMHYLGQVELPISLCHSTLDTMTYCVCLP